MMKPVAGNCSAELSYGHDLLLSKLLVVAFSRIKEMKLVLFCHCWCHMTKRCCMILSLFVMNEMEPSG